MNKEPPDFSSLWQRFASLSPGQKAELRRVSDPEDLRDYTSVVYRLFPGQSLHAGHLRVAFLLPWIEHVDNPAGLGRQWVEAKVADARVLQVARSDEPNDLIQFRRLAMQVKPRVDWSTFWKTLWYWGPRAKRGLVENFYLAKFAPIKGGHQ